METLGVILILILILIDMSLSNIHSALDDIADELRKRRKNNEAN